MKRKNIQILKHIFFMAPGFSRRPEVQAAVWAGEENGGVRLDWEAHGPQEEERKVKRKENPPTLVCSH